MIQAERAQRIMQLYERDYDNFLDKLKKKAADRKTKKGKTSQEAVNASKTLQEAKEHKGTHLAQKAKDLLDKNGGMEGAKHTVQNVMKYFKDNTPSDYSVSMGGTGDSDKPDTKDEKPAGDKTIMGMPPIAVYAGGTVILLLAIWGLSIVASKHQEKMIAAQKHLSIPTH